MHQKLFLKICTVREKTFASLVQQHILRIHKRKENFKCDFCPKAYSVVTDLSRHVSTLHNYT